MLGAVADILRSRGSEGWLVGGSVRDRMLARYSPDFDVVVADDVAAVAKQVAAALRAPCFTLSERYPTYRILGSDGHIDLTSVRGDGILDDLAERDFTVNAMAVPVALVAQARDTDTAASFAEDASLVDPFGGAAHLRQKRLVAVSDHIFADDALRLMRAPRFCHILGLELDDALEGAIRDQAASINGVATERVASEMFLTLASGRAAEAARLWQRLGLLPVLLPESQAAGGLSRGLAAGTLARLESLDEMLDRPADFFPATADFIQERLARPVGGAVPRPVALRLAALLLTLDVEQTHAAGRRLKLSGNLISLLTTVSLCFASAPGLPGGLAGGVRLPALLPNGVQVSRAAVLLLWDAAPWEPEIVMLAALAERAAATPSAAERADSDEAAMRLMDLAARRARGAAAPCPVDGDVLMRELGLASGPELGRALREARLAWEAGEAKTAAEVLAVTRTVVS